MHPAMGAEHLLEVRFLCLPQTVRHLKPLLSLQNAHQDPLIPTRLTTTGDAFFISSRATMPLTQEHVCSMLPTTTTYTPKTKHREPWLAQSWSSDQRCNQVIYFNGETGSCKDKETIIFSIRLSRSTREKFAVPDREGATFSPDKGNV